MCAKSKNFQLIMWSVGFQITYFFVFTTILGDMVGPFEFVSAAQVSYLGTFYELMGIVGGSLTSFIIYKTRNQYKLLSNISCVGSFLTFLIIVIAIAYRNLALLYFACLVNGFLNLSIFSVGYEYGAKAAAPAEEGLSVGCINMVCQACGFFAITGLTDLLQRKDGKAGVFTDHDRANVYKACIVLGAFLLASMVIMFFADKNVEDPGDKSGQDHQGLIPVDTREGSEKPSHIVNASPDVTSKKGNMAALV